mgnify:CR=1 FL=1
MKQEIIKKVIVVFLFASYMLMGIVLYKDYGISTDEPTERESTFTNIKYVLDLFDIDKLNGANGDLENYKDKYYGVVMQVPPALIEWAKDFPGGSYIYFIRHLWTFLVCLMGYICFYLMCREIFESRWIGLLGTAMIALYPRFFAEQFYNIKDMLFTAMFMVSMFVTVKVIQSRYSIFWTVLFSIITAVTTNVRIVGLIFPVLLVGYLILITMLDKCGIGNEVQGVSVIGRIILIIVGYLLTYIVCMPILWKHPIREMIAVFTRFSDFDSWHGTIVFMGRIIGGQDIPWYYIPIWLFISLPVWYLVLSILVLGIFSFIMIRKLRMRNKISFDLFMQKKFVLWAFLLAFLPWFATVVAHSTLYNGWRHCYFLLPPVILMILSLLNYIWNYLKGRWAIKGGILAIILAGLLFQAGWIVKNHPYEMVYLNSAGRRWGAYFDRDYWHLANVELCRYILEHDDSEKVLLQTSNDVFMRFLEENEKERIVLDGDDPQYIIETYRGKIGNDCAMKGYEDYYFIMVDGYRIATIFKKCS